MAERAVFVYAATDRQAGIARHASRKVAMLEQCGLSVEPVNVAGLGARELIVGSTARRIARRSSISPLSASSAPAWEMMSLSRRQPESRSANAASRLGTNGLDHGLCKTMYYGAPQCQAAFRSRCPPPMAWLADQEG